MTLRNKTPQIGQVNVSKDRTLTRNSFVLVYPVGVISSFALDSLSSNVRVGFAAIDQSQARKLSIRTSLVDKAEVEMVMLL